MTFIRSGDPGRPLSMLGQVIPSSSRHLEDPVGQLPFEATSAGEHIEIVMRYVKVVN